MNVFFRGISFVWALAALALLAAIFGVRAWLAYGRLSAEASSEWDYRVSENMQDLRLDRAGFVRAYRRVNAPRFSAYMGFGFLAILILTPIVFMLINVGLWGLWKATGESRVFEPGYLVWEFSIFFALIGAWALMAASVARRYHANAPGLMRDELMFERAGFMPTQRLTIGANPAHIKSSPKRREQYRKMFSVALGLERKIYKNWNNTKHNCDCYSGGEGMEIYVHSAAAGQSFDKKTHPFFFTKKHAREEGVTVRYSIIMHLDSVHQIVEKIAKLGLPLEKMTGNETSRMRSFSHKNLDIFLYNKD